jgi:tRNA nucleotidyltransferase/poly(A) polymerase
MADYLYMMETRLSPEQQRGVALAQESARAHGLNIYLSGGTIRDIVSGFPIRDLDMTIEGNPAKLQRDLEKAGVEIDSFDEQFGELYFQMPGKVRGSINMARREQYGKPGKLPQISSASIQEDLRRRDFSVNAMALSLNVGSRGLLLDPSNGIADIEAKLIRVLHNYSFLEDPSRLIRAAHFIARFHWTLEERTQARYNAAVENKYIEHIHERAIGREIEQLGYEDDPVPIMRSLEKEGWLKVLHPHWGISKVDTQGLAQLLKCKQQITELGYPTNLAAAVLYFLTARMSNRDIAEMQKLIPHKRLVKSWQNLEGDAKELAKRLTSKEAATPSRTWNLLAASAPESIVFVETTSRQQAAVQKIRNYFGKWRQIKQRFPLPEMLEMRITPEHPEYPKLVDQMFFLMLDGKLRSTTEIQKFLKPYAPPPPPPPPPPKRTRGKKEEAPPAEEPTKKKGHPKGAAAVDASAIKKCSGTKKEPEAPAKAPAKGKKQAKAAPARKKVAKLKKPRK